MTFEEYSDFTQVFENIVTNSIEKEFFIIYLTNGKNFKITYYDTIECESWGLKIYTEDSHLLLLPSSIIDYIDNDYSTTEIENKIDNKLTY